MPGCFRSGHLLGAARLAPPYKGIRRAEEALTSYSCSPVVGRSALRLNSQFRLTKIQSAVFLGAMCENLEGYPKKLAACEAEIRERAGHPLVDSVFNPLALDAADAGRKITTQVKSNGAYDLDNLLTKFVASCQKQALDAEQHHRSLVVASLFLTAICAFVVRRHRVMFQQNPLKGCRTMFAFAGLKVALGILLIRTRPSCSPGCGEYFEICTRQPALFYPVVVFLIALRWIYLGVMFYRKIGTGPLVVALPPLARVVVCDEDEESPQADRK